MLVTLEEAKRIDVQREMVGIFSQDLPLLPLYYEMEAVAVGWGLTGVMPITGISDQGSPKSTWNIHEWDVATKL